MNEYLKFKSVAAMCHAFGLTGPACKPKIRLPAEGLTCLTNLQIKGWRMAYVVPRINQW